MDTEKRLDDDHEATAGLQEFPEQMNEPNMGNSHYGMDNSKLFWSESEFGREEPEYTHVNYSQQQYINETPVLPHSNSSHSLWKTGMYQRQKSRINLFDQEKEKEGATEYPERAERLTRKPTRASVIPVKQKTSSVPVADSNIYQDTTSHLRPPDKIPARYKMSFLPAALHSYQHQEQQHPEEDCQHRRRPRRQTQQGPRHEATKKHESYNFPVSRAHTTVRNREQVHRPPPHRSSQKQQVDSQLKNKHRRDNKDNKDNEDDGFIQRNTVPFVILILFIALLVAFVLWDILNTISK